MMSLLLFTLLCVLSPWIPESRAALTADQIKAFTDRGVTVRREGNSYRFEHHGVPDHDHGPFPGPHNPNEVTVQNHTHIVPLNANAAEEAGCLPMGSIGMAINGVSLFNPFTSDGENAVEGPFRETFDECDGHPERDGMYHYHKLPSCIVDGSRDQILGIAFDGFLIYGALDADGNTLTTQDLDECHGLEVDGVYRYHMTADYPYVMGCYHGNTPPGGMPPGSRCYFAIGLNGGMQMAGNVALVLAVLAGSIKLTRRW